ncbi:hypothetical protein HF086_003821 [Spodoptera exigua]|uniref:Uncharacterized protein n=1 Tax=Spodoptera exigua TaxID=7107 RepID=A0A922SP80_SPOEX|nr:hypothetical protein HF086_003821 [Spodoptera exigua]
MDTALKNHKKRYDRVMSRVHSQSQSSLRLSSTVTRHDTPSSVRVGAKTISSNVSSGIFNELPTYLDDYEPEPSRQKIKRTYVVKPRKTITSMNLIDCPPRVATNFSKTRESNSNKKKSTFRVQESAPSVLESNGEKWSNTYLRECLSSRSHTQIKDLKDEIKAYKETEKMMRLRSSLFKKCGVVLDDVGNMVEDKAVQAELEPVADDDIGQEEKR